MKNIYYTMASNAISLFISTLVILIIPKFIGVTEYSYFQLYFFYSSYVFLANFGWNDGIYLRYGGREYRDLDKPRFASQFYTMILFQAVLGGSAVLYALFNRTDDPFILHAVLVCMFLTNTRAFLHYTMLATNRMEEHAKSNILDRLLYCLLIAGSLIAQLGSHKALIAADLAGKLVSLLYAAYCCRDIVGTDVRLLRFHLREIGENIRAGIKLMTADLAGMLNIGIIRIGMERTWDVTTFGKVSLTLSISNLLMLFVNAVSLVLFPLLRRSSEQRYPQLYSAVRHLFVGTMLAIMTLYWPVKLLLRDWLPQYGDTFDYLAILFPLCLYEGRMALLVSTFLKTLRREGWMLRLNMLSLGLSTILAFVSLFLLKSINLAVLSILLASALKCTLSEYSVLRLLKLPAATAFLAETLVVAGFVWTAWFQNSSYSFLLYAVILLVYVALHFRRIAGSLRVIRGFMAGRELAA
ncbi:lipopolysaccharide biosynthesis protein [Paenibacillus glufosinatiresistens]|uniref:lipopolysaccharide biosynthesis protein n=1 Tax=Paenibacillus glufosinatiresistens TaxID=3070657 RepID=UPI00286E7CA8|nr:hypothetical protein [Paenibacillus sp. YX.27]